MAKTLRTLQTLLIQIRNDPRIRAEEHASFCTFSGLQPEQLHVLNVFDEPDFSSDRVLGYDGVFIGGASEASVSDMETYPFVQNCMELILFCLEKDIPCFASCFGFQLVVQALGIPLKKKVKDFEMGTVAIQLTPAAQSDILFHDVPNGFAAVSVHQEYTKTIPDSCELLAYTDACAHAFKVRNKRMWGFQFHPEVDRDCLVERLGVYRRVYCDSDAHYEQIVANCLPTPESNALVSKFVERVLLADQG